MTKEQQRMTDEGSRKTKEETTRMTKEELQTEREHIVDQALRTLAWP